MGASSQPLPEILIPQDLRESIIASEGASPILHHLNADSSWLLQIPYPADAPSQNGRRFFNIVLDPWLSGPQSDVASWFSKQWHAIKPAYSGIAAVEALCWEVEGLLGGATVGKKEERAAVIDVVGISHEFTDHCHEGTLRELGPETTVFGNDKAIQIISSWKHFKPSSLHDIPAFSPSILKETQPPLPPHIRISRLQNKGDFVYYHSAVVISFQLSASSPHQCLIYTPHGIPAVSEDPFAGVNPSMETLVLLHGLHDVSIPWGGPIDRWMQQLNLGAHNALKLQRKLKARYWCSTHDEVKKGGGLVGMILKRKVITLEEALKVEDEKVDDEVKVIDMENGRGMVLA